ncbi:MAG: carbon-nitrogen hydrolase [Planctomycetes bacterium]|nr:carbon-nitrogen hydrolase [Planctomycetota bacterium]
MDCRLVVAQTNPALGDLRANLEDHLQRIDALAGAADLILFPELSLTGYFLKDQVADVAMSLDDTFLRPLLERSRHLSIALGMVERSPEGRLFNSLVFFEDGRVLGVHRKVHLVSYGLFDEGRDFAAGEEFRVIQSRHGRFGPLICEDMWHMPGAYTYFLDDADALLVASASPARGVEAPGPGLASQRTWNILLSASCLMYRTWVAYASRVGWEDGIGFGGGSRVLDPYANARAALEGLEPGTLSARLDSAVLRRARTELPLRRDEKPWVLAAELGRHVPLLRALRAEHALRDE